MGKLVNIIPEHNIWDKIYSEFVLMAQDFSFVASNIMVIIKQKFYMENIGSIDPASTTTILSIPVHIQIFEIYSPQEYYLYIPKLQSLHSVQSATFQSLRLLFIKKNIIIDRHIIKITKIHTPLLPLSRTSY